MTKKQPQQQALLSRARLLRLELARRDPNVFVPMVLRDEETGDYVKQAPYHSDWQTVVTNNKRVVLWSHVESGKTQQITIARVLWELGKDPSLRVALVSNTGTQATKMLRSIAKYITDSEEVKRVFPHLKPGGQWTSEAITVERDIPAKDPTIQATGMHGNILGARLDMLILDDVLDYENTRTDYQRSEALRWIESTLFGRLTRRARVVFIGNAWHRNDAMHMLAQRPGWHGVKYTVADPVTMESNWPERWDKARIIDKQQELGPLEFARQMMCEPRADGQSRFLSTDIEKCLDRGRGMTFVHDATDVAGTIITGVDLAVSKKSDAAMTVFFTIAILPSGDRQVLNIHAGRWTAQEIINHLEATYKKYGGHIFVESNAAQKFIVQLAQDKDLPVRPFHTGKNKTHPMYGVESLSAEFARGQWIIPCNPDGSMEKVTREWVDEILYYDPMSHTGDRLMASWIAREGARRSTGVYRFALAGEGVSTNDAIVDSTERFQEDRPDTQGAILWAELGNMFDIV